jgi:hypothetical protein
VRDRNIKRRRWLCSNTDSYVSWQVRSYSNSSKKYGRSHYINGYLDIADCGRRIQLHFDEDYSGKLKLSKETQALKKIDNLIGEIQDFRAAMVSEYKRQRDYMSKGKKK